MSSVARIVHTYPTDYWHGDFCIREVCEVDWSSAGVLFGDPATPSVSQPVFLDIETTGLSGGAGTYAFLIGIAIGRPHGIETTQLLMLDFEGERDVLQSYLDVVSQPDPVVTFNGKSFDAPVLEMRCALHRMTSPLEGCRHLDVLHASRRLWRRRTGGFCGLGDLEAVLLGVHRKGDIPGHQIPGQYFRYIRSAQPALLDSVLEHNRLDLLSLVGITTRLLSLIQGGAPVAHDADECLGLGRLFERAALYSTAMRCYESASQLADDPSVRREALSRMARRFRSERRHEEAAQIWMELVESSSEAVEALAVHLEHRVKDLVGARSLVERAAHGCAQPRWRASFEYRLRRLGLKLGGRAARPDHEPASLWQG